MTLNEIPVISKESYEAHLQCRYRNRHETNRFVSEFKDYLRSKNPVMNNLIETCAENSSRPGLVRFLVYSLLDLINAELESQKLE